MIGGRTGPSEGSGGGDSVVGGSFVGNAGGVRGGRVGTMVVVSGMIIVGAVAVTVPGCPGGVIGGKTGPSEGNGGGASVVGGSFVGAGGGVSVGRVGMLVVTSGLSGMIIVGAVAVAVPGGPPGEVIGGRTGPSDGIGVSVGIGQTGTVIVVVIAGGVIDGKMGPPVGRGGGGAVVGGSIVEGVRVGNVMVGVMGGAIGVSTGSYGGTPSIIFSHVSITWLP